MSPTEYSAWRRTVDIYPQNDITLAFHTLGLAGEAGEVAEKVKKFYRADYGMMPRQDLAKELGDVLWYLTAVADDLGFTLQEILDLNVEKLNDRKARQTQRGDGDNR